MEFADLQAVLGGASPMTVHRYLRQVPYRCSYNQRGRYYTRHDSSRYDRFGLYSHGDIHFSVDGSLKNTVRRMVLEAEAGATQKELQARLRVRVHNTLLELVRAEEIHRERLASVFLYLHTDATIRADQLRRRREHVRLEPVCGVVDLDLEDVIEVLLVLLRYPGSRPQDVARRLRGHEPPIRIAQIQAVFDRYDLGEKGGSTSS